MEITNLHIYPSAFKYESRIWKETSSIMKLGLASNVIILSAGEKNQVIDEELGPGIVVHRLVPFIKNLDRSKVIKAIFYFEFYWRAFFYMFRQKVDVLNCHSLMLLPLAVWVKKIKNCKLVYDPHELETERLGLQGVGKIISKWVERKFIYSSDAIIVVSESILKWYTASYQLTNIFWIPNVPLFFQTKRSTLLREKFGVPDHQLIFIYQGLIGEGRNIELYLKAFSKMDYHHLVIMGYGPLEFLVNQYSDRCSNIHFMPAVKPSQVLDYTSSADIGLSVIENCCLSYYFSLPNKFFEYIMAEIPLVVSNFPDMADLVKMHDVGWVVDASEESLVHTIECISMEQIELRVNNLKKIKARYKWENEEHKYAKIYKEFQLKF